MTASNSLGLPSSVNVLFIFFIYAPDSLGFSVGLQASFVDFVVLMCLSWFLSFFHASFMICFVSCVFHVFSVIICRIMSFMFLSFLCFLCIFHVLLQVFLGIVSVISFVFFFFHVVYGYVYRVFIYGMHFLLCLKVSSMYLWCVIHVVYSCCIWIVFHVCSISVCIWCFSCCVWCTFRVVYGMSFMFICCTFLVGNKTVLGSLFIFRVLVISFMSFMTLLSVMFLVVIPVPYISFFCLSSVFSVL